MFLIAQEGPFKDLKLDLKEGNEWIIGRDPDQANFVLNDNSVSRKHAKLYKKDDAIYIKNLSTTNPVEVNSSIIDEYPLTNGDLIKIGNTLFKYLENEIQNEEIKEDKTIYETIFEDKEKEALSFPSIEEATFILKVISGPNSGAEFGMDKSKSYILGKDPESCDIAFNDLSISKQHAKIDIDDVGNFSIEDLGSKNGTFVNGLPIKEKTVLSMQDFVNVGTTSFLIVDQKSSQETIYTPAPVVEIKEEEKVVEKTEEISWKKQKIPFPHLFAAGACLIILFFVFLSFFGLLKPKGIELTKTDPSKIIKKALEKYDDVKFSYNSSGETLFLVGHVLTPVDKQELLYNVNQLSFVDKIEDNIVIDEYVWKTMNDTLMENENWRSVSIHSPIAGKFVISGYMQTPEDVATLMEYVNANFPYLDKLENKVAIEQILKAQIASLLASKSMSGLSFKLTAGNLILDGRYDEKLHKNYESILNDLKSIQGIHNIKSLAIPASSDNARMDLSTKYAITGYATEKNKNVSVVANGKIVSTGDLLDGMKITSINANTILLEKDGIKYKIGYSR
jgi:type III secretion system YscD/HrpQ family protein